MAIENFIPELWSTRINVRLRKELVFGSICNRDYEGEIANEGNVIRINHIGPITVGTYIPNQTVITPQELTDFQTQLRIDQAKYFSFTVDDVEAAQANVEIMDEAIQEASWSLRNEADAYVASLWTEAGFITTSTAVNSVNVLAALLSLGQKLSENNVPRDGRWVVLPPWMTTKLALAKVLVPWDASRDAFENGFQGRVAGFDVYESNNVFESGGTYRIMAGHRRAIAFVGQSTKIEAYRREASFSDAVKGLYLYGAKVIYPDALVVLTATVAAEP